MKTIFVSIASYKDPEFIPTVNDCLNRAKYPERIKIGLHLQDTKEILEKYNNNNIKILKTLSEEAEGCGWARNEIMKKLYNNEDYFFLVDSHTRFKQNWDVEYIHRLESLPNNAVISVFPRDYQFDESYEQYSKKTIPTIYIPNDIPFVGNFIGPHKQKLCKKPFEKVMNISGGNTFGPGSMVQALALDEYKFYGHQEQEIYSLLLYTSGYDIYAINSNIVWHKYFVPGIDTYRKTYSENKIKENFWPKLKNYKDIKRTTESWIKEYKEFCFNSNNL
jgi:hypothetical protein